MKFGVCLSSSLLFFYHPNVTNKIKMLIKSAVWLFLTLFTLTKGTLFNNTKQINLNANHTSPFETVDGVKNLIEIINPSNMTKVQHVSHQEVNSNYMNMTNNTLNEIFEIFGGESNVTKNFEETTEAIEKSSSTTSTILTTNDTLKINFTVVVEAVASSDDTPTFRLQNSAAIAAGVCLISGVIGYLSCVGYRRYLQKKYGDSEMISPEDSYDTSDLRYFEI